MAKFRNSNAEAEVQKIKQAKTKLEEAHKLLNPSKLDSECMQGETRDALEEIFRKFSEELGIWEEGCSTIATHILNTVKKYKDIDREYADKINGGQFSGSGASHSF